MWNFLRQALRPAPSAPVVREPITGVLRDWIFDHFPGAWSLKTFDPQVFAQERELNIWCHWGQHRVSFLMESGELIANVALGYSRVGIPLAHVEYRLGTPESRVKFISTMNELRDYVVPDQQRACTC